MVPFWGIWNNRLRSLADIEVAKRGQSVVGDPVNLTLQIAPRLLVCGLAAWAATGNAEAASCLSGLKRALIFGHFSGPLDCGREHLTVREIGRVRIRERKFIVYDYTYKLRPACEGCTIHGGQRILIFDRGRYLGQHKTDFARVSMRGGNLIFRPSGMFGLRRQTSVVKITYGGVPKRILADGEDVSFFR